MNRERITYYGDRCEESLYIVSAIWSQGHADRNDVVFMDKYEFEEKYVEVAENAD